MKVEILHDPVADSKPRLQSQHSRGRLSSMGSFRTLLVILWLALAAYTAVVISRHGLGLLPIFFGDMAKLGWPGQFNLDFLSFLILSALWTAWRNGFTAIDRKRAVKGKSVSVRVALGGRRTHKKERT